MRDSYTRQLKLANNPFLGTCKHCASGESQRRLRAIVELIDGELEIYPIGQSDAECNEILQALLLDGGREPRQ